MFIKQKKQWKDEFSEEDLNLLWEASKKSFSTSNGGRTFTWESDDQKEYVQYIRNYTIYPETYKSDDTLGFSPKQGKKLLKYKSFLNEIFDLISLKIRNGNLTDFLDSDVNKLNLKKYLNSFLDDFLVPEVLAPELFKKQFGTKYLLDPSVFKKFLKTDMTEELKSVIDANILPSGSLLTGKNDLESFKKELSKKWEELHNFVPKDIDILMLNPEYFSKEVWSELAKVMFDKKYIDLTKNEKSEMLKYYKHFGVASTIMYPYIKFSSEELYDMFDKTPPILTRILDATKRGINPELSQDMILKIFKAIIFCNTESLMNKDQLSISDLNALVRVGSYRDIQMLNNFDFRIVSMFIKANGNINVLPEYIKLFERTKNVKSSLPNIEFTSGDYLVKVHPKNDIEGLFVGLATNCCQHLEGAAANAVIFGAENENAGFMSISRNGEILAQSFLWVEDNIIVLDSVEAKLKNQQIANAYLEFRDKLKEIYDDVHFGALGGLQDYLKLKETESIRSSFKFYTDAETQYK